MFGNKKNVVKEKRKRIMLVCGSGIVTSTLIMGSVEDILTEGKIRYDILKSSVGELKSMGKNANVDMIITTLEIDESMVNCPVIMARELLSGMATPELKEKILNKLK